MTDQQDMSSGQETTIVDNEVYNVISTLANKLEALAAYDKYAQDGQANDQLWQIRVSCPAHRSSSCRANHAP